MDTVRETGQSRPTPVGDVPDMTRVEAMRKLLDPQEAKPVYKPNRATLALLYVLGWMKRFGLAFGRPTLGAE